MIPASIRRSLGIGPGCQLEFHLEGNVIRAEVKRRMTPTRAEDGFGMLVCERPGTRRLAEFDVATAMREANADDRD
ncbi:AbrB family transcriptional regulator [Thioalkalivibrio nitratireducens DSM 14787]|uniref:AbrB family transcriptional regulator n=1 Tax=Thioalkalivibrio nitratireducens (strain DSM 14787 / UNIQEM 213 / ALEN2) TaxID=1255043 RepID=L0DRW9_THIND|nr:AbrB family transcriptional regulator [Thioalkalivibrio nitratireducens DSM 14787]